MKNYRGRRRAPINVRNNVRTEPVSIVILSTQFNATADKQLSFILPADVAERQSRISSLLLPETINSVTDYSGTTYYPARAGSWKIKFSKVLLPGTWAKYGGFEFKATTNLVSDDVEQPVVQAIVTYKN